MANEVRILVRTQNSAKAGFEEAGKEVDAQAKKMSESFANKFSDTLTKNLTMSIGGNIEQIGNKVRDAGGRAGDTIGDTIGRRASEQITRRINEGLTRDANGRLRDSRGRFVGGSGSGGSSSNRVTVDVDIDRQSFLQRVSSLASQMGARFRGAMQTAMTSVFSGDLISTTLKAGGIAALAGTIAPVLAAIITSGVLLALGGGAIGAGVALAFKHPRIKEAIEGLKGELSRLGDRFGANFLPAVENFIAAPEGGGAGLVSVIKQLTPMIEHLGRVFGPVAGKLGQGLIGMLQNMMPGLLRAMEASAPLVETLAEELPGIGDAIGRFFDRIKNGAPDANQFLKDLLNAIQIVIRILGFMIEVFTRMYSIVRPILVGLAVGFLSMAGIIINAAAIAFGWIPGLGPRLRGLATKFNNFRDDVLEDIRAIPSQKTFTLRMQVVGLAAARAAVDVARILRGKSHGGIQGAADGGMKSGLTWVGEHGAELISLPPGAQVHSSADSKRIAGQGGGSGFGQASMRVSIDETAASERRLIDNLIRMLRLEIYNISGGDVQQALGT